MPERATPKQDLDAVMNSTLIDVPAAISALTVMATENHCGRNVAEAALTGAAIVASSRHGTRPGTTSVIRV
jgi:hypothetical protein